MKANPPPPSPPSPSPSPSPFPPPPPRPDSTSPATFSTPPVHKTLTSVANLANLLPTGTVLAFRTLTPSFSDEGICQISNKCLTAALIVICSITCFLSSFTDSFTDRDGKLYYGIATFKGLHVFSSDRNMDNLEELLLEAEEEIKASAADFSKFSVSLIDFVHASVSLFAFLAFALSDSDVKHCFFPGEGENLGVLVKNLPLAAGIFSSFLFTIFPTARRGIGYADVTTKFK